MAKSKSNTFPRFGSLDDLVEFFDANDLGEYLEQMPEVGFEVDIKQKTHLFVLDEGLVNKLMEIARSNQMPSETLINAWLREKILEHTP